MTKKVQKKGLGLTKKLVWSMISVLFAAVSMVTASYAWFSMNNTVSVTGMEITTQVENNLAIAPSTAGVNKVADSEFRSALHQATSSASLQPVSTVDGINFFYTNDAAEDGQKVGSNPFTAVNDNTITINSKPYKGYTDYVFELKATNTGDSDAILYLSKLNLLYLGNSKKVTHAFRVAVFVQSEVEAFTNATEDARKVAYTGAYSTLGDVDRFFAYAGSSYFDNKAVQSTTNLVTAPTVNNGAVDETIAAGKTKYFKVTVRLWLEGQDTDCYNTKFVELTSKWNLDLAFKLDTTATSPATSLDSTANASISVDSNSLTAALDESVGTASSYQWYKVGSSDGVTGATAATYTAPDDAYYYCAITTTKGNVYYTPAAKKAN